ncbi:MAG: GNAT family N-acetyltransferase [Ferruginibacter sp.]
MNVNIRNASKEDLPVIISLIHEFAAFQQTPQKVAITLEQMQAETNLFQCLVAENEAGEILGFASFFFAYYSWTGKALYLDDLYVTANYRKLNIGSGLINAVIDLAKAENCKKVKWQVSQWNENAINFYKKMGAVIDNTEINCDLDLSKN